MHLGRDFLFPAIKIPCFLFVILNGTSSDSPSFYQSIVDIPDGPDVGKNYITVRPKVDLHVILILRLPLHRVDVAYYYKPAPRSC